MDTSFKKILFCTDFSRGAARAFRFALGEAERNHAELHILHVTAEADSQFWKGYVVDDGQDLAAKNDNALNERIRREYAGEIGDGISWQVHLATGDPAEKIVEFVRDNGISLVVLGRPRPHFLRSTLFGSVATKVAREVGCPLLIVPEPESGETP